MNVDIELLRGDKRWTFDKREVRIGRDPDCDVRFQAEEFLMVSRHHALLRIEQGAAWIEDLNSFNGTLLNGERIQKERLRSGDVVRLGEDGPELRFTVGAPTDQRITRMPSTAELAAARAAADANATRLAGSFDSRETTFSRPLTEESRVPATGASPAPSRYDTPSAATPYATDQLSSGDEAMLERKLALVRNLLILTLIVCVALAGVVVYQGQQIKKNRDTLNVMQRQAESAVGALMPELDRRLKHFDNRLDQFDGRMTEMDKSIKRAEDRFVVRLETEMPRIMDRYLAMKAEEIKRGARANVQVR